ncbi:MAG: carotenoid 1,2-hydratase [Candidatus Eremiobacteraeota bacterium]|nr:carotenoid 1,2-hydratase [Candidatus Eremiobacteraeota bacterium]
MNKIRCLVLISAIALSGAARSVPFSAAVAPYHFVFPRDHGSHPSYRTEWWYFTGHLQSSSGHRFGYELTFFRVGLAPSARAARAGKSAWHGTQLYPAHFAITDEQSGRFIYYESFARDALGQAGAGEGRLSVHVHNWELTGAMPFHLRAASGPDAIALSVTSQKPPAIHGQGGVSRKGPCVSCSSHYYSYTRLQTQGTLRALGRTYAVTGTSWMDHEFGSDELQSDQAGWDWFSIQLFDGREIMLYHMRQKDGSTTPESSGSLIGPRGGVRYLPRSGFSIESQSAWVSPHTAAHYPAQWTIRVKGVPTLLLAPVVADQELVNASNGVTYWEGAVAVRSTTGALLGYGYVELTGYANPVRL